MVRMGERGQDAAQLGQALEPADCRIAGLGAAPEVVEDVVAVVGAKRGRARRAAALRTGDRSATTMATRSWRIMGLLPYVRSGLRCTRVQFQVSC